MEARENMVFDDLGFLTWENLPRKAGYHVVCFAAYSYLLKGLKWRWLAFRYLVSIRSEGQEIQESLNTFKHTGCLYKPTLPVPGYGWFHAHQPLFPYPQLSHSPCLTNKIAFIFIYLKTNQKILECGNVTSYLPIVLVHIPGPRGDPFHWYPHTRSARHIYHCQTALHFCQDASYSWSAALKAARTPKECRVQYVCTWCDSTVGDVVGSHIGM